MFREVNNDASFEYMAGNIQTLFYNDHYANLLSDSNYAVGQANINNRVKINMNNVNLTKINEHLKII